MSRPRPLRSGAPWRSAVVARLGAGLLLAVLLVAATTAGALAQAASSTPPALPPPGPAADPGAGVGGLPGFFSDPGAWASAVFNAALVGLARGTSTDVVDLMGWLLGSGNVISQTPPRLSYDNEAVRTLWGASRGAANAALALVTAWGGLSLIVQPHLRSPYHGVLELLPRLVLGGLLVNTSLDWGHVVIDLNNALCRMVGAAVMPAWDVVVHRGVSSVLVDLVAVLIYLVMGLLLLLQMLARLALVDALLVVAPLALLCWMLPQTQGWARLWLSTFFATVFAQFLQVVVLQLGVELVRHVPDLLPAAAADPVDSGRTWLVALLLGVAVLQLARGIPRLLPGSFGTGGGSTLVRSIVLRGLMGRRGK